MYNNSYNKRVLYDNTVSSRESIGGVLNTIFGDSDWFLMVDNRAKNWYEDKSTYLIRSADISDKILHIIPDDSDKFIVYASTFAVEIVTDYGVICVYKLSSSRLNQMTVKPKNIAYPHALDKIEEREVRMAIIHFMI